MSFSLTPIGFLETCFKEKFSIPRQTGLTPLAWGRLVLSSDPRMEEAVHELDGFEYIWLISIMDDGWHSDWKARVRPPRLGGDKSVGVFASRSPQRPNPLGLSCCRLEKIEKADRVTIWVSGVDLLDGTAIVDIKPYLPYSDSHEQASSGWVTEDWNKLHVIFEEEALSFLNSEKVLSNFPKLKDLIEQCLSLDPRPAQQRKTNKKKDFAFKLESFDIQWRLEKETCVVYKIVDLT